MSPLNKSARPRCTRHLPRWPSTAALSNPPASLPAAEIVVVPIAFDGCHVGDLHVRPGTNLEVLFQAIEQLDARMEWSKLGTSLAALGPHRLAIAGRAAAAAASGGRGMNTEEEDHIAQWFAGIVDEAIHRGGLPAAAAIWLVLAGDDHADPVAARPARCPAVAEVPNPPGDFADEPDERSEMTPAPVEVTAFFAKLRAAAAGYVHTAVACASEADIVELREIVHAADDALEDYRPWGIDFAEEAPTESLESARSMLTCRHLSNTEACSGVADWAHGFAGMVAEHAIPPVFRIGASAWLARVALRDEEHPA